MQLPCPNPVCTHVFSQAEVRGSSALKCPRCGHEFRLRSEPSPAKPAAPRAIPAPASPIQAKPTAPLAKPVQSRPAASAPVAAKSAAVFAGQPPNPFADEAPATRASAEETGNIDFGPPTSLIRRTKGSRRPPKVWKKYVVLAFFALVVIGGMVTAYICIPWPQPTPRGMTKSNEGYKVTIRNLKNADEFAFKVVLADADSWVYDRNIIDDFRVRSDDADNNLDEPVNRDIGVDLALRHREKDVWIAFAAKDYGLQLPRSAEMLYQASLRLKKFFGESLETAEKVEQIELAGQAGHRLRFKGYNRVNHHGECYMVARNGIGYWIFVGAPTLKEAQQGLTELQENGRGFTFFTDRRGWREQPPRTLTYNAERYPLSLSAIEGIYQKQPNGREFEETCELYLLGKYAREKDNRKNSTVMVLVLPKQDNIKEAVKFARKYVEERRTGPKDFKYSHVPITPDGEEAKEGEASKEADKIGNKLGRTLEMKVMLGDDPVRYLLLAVVNEPDAVVVVWCESIWEHRQIWREDFRDLLSSVNIRKKE